MGTFLDENELYPDCLEKFEYLDLWEETKREKKINIKNNISQRVAKFAYLRKGD